MKPYLFPRWLLLTMLLVMAVLLGGGIWFFRAQQAHMRKMAENELFAIAEMKNKQIVTWREDQLAEAQELMDSLFLKEGVVRWMVSRDAESEEMILARMRSIQQHYDYEDVLLVDAAGKVLLNLGDRQAQLDADTLLVLEEALRTRQALLTDLHLGFNDRSPHIGAFAPLFLDQDIISEPIGAFVLQSDARQFLYPLIMSWPLPSRSAETLLVRRDGDEVLFLNDLKHQQNTALQLRIPLSETQVPAVKAVLGETGFTEGLDYRSVPVLSVIKPVPDSPWFMVAKVDSAEALAVWRTSAGLIVVLLLGLTAAAAGSAGMLWQRSATIHYRNLALAESARTTSEAQYRLLFESMLQGVVYQDKDGRIIDANPAAERMLGLSLDRMRGLTSTDPSWQAVHEDGTSFPGEQHPSTQALRSGQPVNGVIMGVYNPQKNDRTWINIHAVPQFRAGEDEPYQVFTTLEDITTLMKAQQSLRESEAYIKNILDNLPIGVSVNSVDSQVAFSYINENFIKIYRTTREALQKPDGFWEAVYPDEQQREEIRSQVLADCASGNPQRMRWEDIPISRPGEETTYISAQNIPVPEGDEMVSVVWDSTHRKLAEQYLRVLNEELEQRVVERTAQLEDAQQKLLRQERLAVLGQLAGSVSHELRNPLGVISNALYLLQQMLPKNEQKAHEYLDIIKSETHNAENIITDLLDFSRSKEPEKKPVQVSELVRKSLERYPAPENIQVEVHISEGLQPFWVDARQIDQVLGNLLVNAYQAMPQGGSLRIQGQQELHKDADYIALRVIDNGLGITEADMAHLFEPLFTTKARGIGLGLTTSKNLVELNDGWMTVESREGQGTAFSVFLPAKRS